MVRQVGCAFFEVGLLAESSLWDKKDLADQEGYKKKNFKAIELSLADLLIYNFLVKAYKWAEQAVNLFVSLVKPCWLIIKIKKITKQNIVSLIQRYEPYRESILCLTYTIFYRIRVKFEAKIKK